jgi:hypothetical protein
MQPGSFNKPVRHAFNQTSVSAASANIQIKCQHLDEFMLQCLIVVTCIDDENWVVAAHSEIDVNRLKTQKN